MKDPTPQEKQEIAELYCAVRKSMIDADADAVKLVADMYNVTEAEVRLWSFIASGGQPPRMPPTGAARAVRGLSLVLKGRQAA